ncbi:unnamed protein product [Dovyalis caffra]|uniref:Uncharacterized protein n=1 Tax=Dovyalis caffra TaxID=77055 RepID=A0AAV1QMX3_9ROSI|nr:unnamed protein product [Dovyalis caffra]
MSELCSPKGFNANFVVIMHFTSVNGFVIDLIIDDIGKDKMTSYFRVGKFNAIKKQLQEIEGIDVYDPLLKMDQNGFEDALNSSNVNTNPLPNHSTTRELKMMSFHDVTYDKKRSALKDHMIPKVLIDNGFALNVFPKYVLDHVLVDPLHMRSSKMME